MSHTHIVSIVVHTWPRFGLYQSTITQSKVYDSSEIHPAEQREECGLDGL